MKQIRKRTGAILLAASATFALACADIEVRTPDLTSPVDSSLPATIEDLGHAPSVVDLDIEARHRADIERTVATVGYGKGSGKTVTQPEGRASFIAYDVVGEREYRVTVDSPALDSYLSGLDRAQLQQGFAGHGTDATGETEDVEPDRPVPTGWSDGVDNRQKKSTTHNPSRKTVFFSNSCSGALIGPRHVLTAAHCIVSQGTNNWSSFTVRPGGVESPYDTASPIWFYTPDQFRNPGQSQSTYNRYDYALVIIDEDLGDTVGWMGHAAWAGSTLESKTLWNRGYPRCPNGNMNHPAGCNKMGEIWGDRGSCKLGSFFNKENGSSWNANIYNSCDISGGQSGSPVYYYNSNNIPVAIGVQFWENCYTCNAAADFPNRMRRLTPSALNWIATWKATWP